MVNNIYNNRKIIENRKTKPLFKLMGNVSLTDIYPYQALISNWNISDTLTLREKNGIDFDTDKLKFYNHSSIQVASIANPKTSDYNQTLPMYKGLVDTINKILKNTYRMRWAKLEKNQTLEYHLDPPTGDRFILVTEGEHIVEIDKKGDIVRQKMLPGEVWYINSSWYHKVINETEHDRLAILGCFDL